MAKSKRLLAWLLIVVMSFGILGNYGITVSAAQADETGGVTEGFETWAAGITDEAEVAAKKAIWLDATQSVDERVEALLSVMTLEEKVAQMTQPEQNADNGGVTPEQVTELGIGSVFSAGGSQPSTGNSAQNWADMVNAFKEASLKSRLGIPLIYGVDAVHGHNNVDDAVIFPHNIGFAAAGDVALAEKVGRVEAEEIRATGIQWTFTPTLGIVDDERWGRYYEAFGENPELVSEVSSAFVRGLQGTDSVGETIADKNVAATAKHYIGEGQTKNGQNQGDVDMTMEDFEALLLERDIILPYKEAIQAGAKTVMPSFNSINGGKCHGSYRLLTEILKGKETAENPLGLDFQGFVISDYEGIHQIEESTYKEFYFEGSTDKFTAQVAAGIYAGVDMFMEPDEWTQFMNAAIANVEAGVISPERIDDAVSRILRVKFEMGLFEEEVAGEEEQQLLANIGSEEHRTVAKEAVEKSLVVLKNETIGTNGETALELVEAAKDIMVAGYKANDIGAQCGGWTISWQGSMDAEQVGGTAKVTTGTTIYEGFVEEAGENRTVTYNARGKVASGKDAVIVVAGETPYAESAGDRTFDTLVLPDNDLNVIKTVLDSNTEDIPTVLVLTTGRPVAIADFVDDFDAVIQAWLPGTEGDGIASVLLDTEKEFTGTLPVTWTWYPQYLAQKYDADTDVVMFPYGTGLKKDGTSIQEGGQVTLPTKEDRPEAPDEVEAADIPMYKDAIDIDANGGKLEAEWCNPTTGDFGSWNIATGNETVDGETVGYVEFDKKDWGNAKWEVYFRQAGTYKVTARIKVTDGSALVFDVGPELADEVGGTRNFANLSAGDQYVDVVLGTVGSDTLKAPGIFGVKVMDSTSSWVTAQLAAHLDYLMFECVEPVGEKDIGVETEKDDPTDETPMDSEGNIIADDAVKVFFTSTENTQDYAWHKYPIAMANQMSQKTSLDLTSIDDQDLTTISVNPNIEYQELLGIGTSLEESTIGNVIQLNEDMQEEFLRMLVDPEQAGMTLFRVTIGTSDFTGQPFYTYYDVEGNKLTEENAIKNADGNLVPDWYNETGNGFSIQKDHDFGIIKTVQKLLELAKEYGVEDEVRIFASSWTPPGWTKEETEASKSYSNNDLLIKGGSLKDENIEDVAMYYVRFLEEYAKVGIPIYAITLQNEPLLEIDYPSCHMTGKQEGKLAIAIKEAIKASEILSDEAKKVKLWAFDHNPSDAYAYVEDILSIEGANEALDGIAFHDYSGSLTLMQQVLDELLNKNGVTGQTVNLTERAVWGTEGANCIITYLRNSAISYNSWVTMLDSNQGKHQWVGIPAPTMFSRTAGSDNDYWPMPEYYITGQFSKFIRPGYVRVDSNLGSLDTITNVVFKNPDTGELVAVAVNDTDEKQNFKFVCEGTQFIGAIPADSVATYVWSVPDTIHDNIEDGFPAVEYSDKSEGVTTGTDEDTSTYVTMASGDAQYVDYIVNVEEAGTYGVILEQVPTEDGQMIEIYQGDKLLGKTIAAKTWDTAKVKVRAAVAFNQAGAQQIRIKMSPGVKLYNISMVEMPGVHIIPGKVMADEYVAIVDDSNAVAGVTVTDDHKVENLPWWTTVQYKIDVPADGKYYVQMSSATENDESGFIIIVDGNEVLNVVDMDWDNNVGYTKSGSWSTYNLNGAEIELTEGEHVLAFKTAAPLNIEWISVGSYVDVEADEITEGSEDGKEVKITVTGGIIGNVASGDASEEVSGDASEEVSGDASGETSGVPVEAAPLMEEAEEYVTVEGLPAGVDYETEIINESELKLRLIGNRTIDFDRDVDVKVGVLVSQPNGTTTLNNSFTFTIKAVKDDEVLVKSEAITAPEEVGDTVVIPVVLKGGTFNDSVVDEMTITGNALLNYNVSKIEVADSTTANVTLEYTRSIYKDAELNIAVPVTAYSDSKGNAVLTTNVTLKGVAGLPTAISADTNGAIVLTEDKAFASNGSLADGAESGTYLDYFVDIEKTGDYVVTYTLQSQLGDGTSFSSAWNYNRGVPGTIGTNSYKSVSIPGLWTTGDVKMIQAVELMAGQQTFEVFAGATGYKLTKIEIAPRKAVALSKEETTTIDAREYVAVEGNAVIEGDNIGYTGAGTALDYVIDVEQAGKYVIQVNYSIESAGNVKFEFESVTDTGANVLDSVAVSSTGNWSNYTDSEPIVIELPEGESVLRMTMQNGGANTKAIKLTAAQVVTEITLSKETLSMKEGETVELTATVLPEDATDKNVVWTSDNEEVAKVENGIVTAVSAGTATITAIATDGSGVKAACEVIVTEQQDIPTDIPVTDIEISDVAKTIKVGESITLTAVAYPETATDRSIIWQTKEEAIATVDPETGVVTGVAAGTTDIYAIAGDGSNITATCKLTVQNKDDTTDPSNPGGSGDTNNPSDQGGSGDTPQTEKKTYIITFDPANGTASTAAVVEEGATVTPTATPTRTGYTFAGWYNGSVPYTFDTPVKSNLTLTAVWTVNKVNSIKITGISKKIAVNKKIKLTATVNEDALDQSVTWSVNKSKYATVSQSGEVKMKKAGIGKYVIVTATANDGSGVKETYKIKIMKYAVKKITIIGKKTVKAGSKVELKALVTPNKAKSKINKELQWTSNNEEWATVTKKGVVKTKKAGKGKTVKITAKAKDGSNKKKTVKIKIK